MAEGLPPIHDLVRFWQRSEADVLSSCVKFRRTAVPAWTLTWLRHAAPAIMTGELSEDVLRRSVRAKVFPEAQPSVLKAVELFCRFVRKHGWRGNSLSDSSYTLPSGSTVRINSIGRYFSEKTKTNWLVALQPRQDNFPNEEQLRMWRSTLVYEYCDGKDEAMIADLSLNPVSQKRELREITASKFPLFEKSELDERLELIGNCYRKAIALVPERPRRPLPHDDSSGFDFG